MTQCPVIASWSLPCGPLVFESEKVAFQIGDKTRVFLHRVYPVRKHCIDFADNMPLTSGVALKD